MMELFTTRDSIKDLNIYPVRGNHDCMFKDMQAEIKLQEKYPTWKFDSLYYEKQFEVGPDGEKFALLQVDSCFMLCDALLHREDRNEILEKLADDT